MVARWWVWRVVRKASVGSVEGSLGMMGGVG